MAKYEVGGIIKVVEVRTRQTDYFYSLQELARFLMIYPEDKTIELIEKGGYRDESGNLYKIYYDSRRV